MKREFDVKSPMRVLRELQRALVHVSDPGAREEAIRRAKELARRYGDKIAGHKERLRAKFAEEWRRHYTGEPSGDGRPFRTGRMTRALETGAGAVLAVEGSAAAMMGALTFALPTWLAIAVGIVLTLILTRVMTGVIALQRNSLITMPQMVSNALNFWAVVTFILWFGLIATFVTTARPGMENVLTDGWQDLLFNVCLTLLNVISPLLAGLLLSAADHHAWGDPYADAYDELEELESELEMTLALTER